MDFMALVLLFAGIALGAGFGYALGSMRGRQLLAGAVARGEFDALAHDKATLEAKLDSAVMERKSIEDKLEATRSELTETRERVVIADANSRALEQRFREQQQELEKMQERLKLEFKNTATGLLEEMGTKFNKQSEKQVGDLLNPLRERLGEFQKLVGESFSQQGKEQHTLRAEIEKIVLQTDSLTKALRGDVKAQGNWGEVMLERILEESGLEKGIGYIVQGTGMGLTGNDGNRQQPDVTIMLPDNKHIIIDAKVSLTAYERFCSERDEAAREAHLRDYLKSIRAHVAGLEQRRYQDNDKLNPPDFVFMFMPVEGAFSFAMQEDRDLQQYAWSKRIILVSPTMLFANLRTIASIWRIERQNRYAQEIASQGGKLYDKFAGFVDDMLQIGKQVTGLQKTYDGAMNKLSEGRGNLIGSAEKLKLLGVKASKSLPKELMDDEPQDEDDNERNLLSAES